MRFVKIVCSDEKALLNAEHIQGVEVKNLEVTVIFSREKARVYNFVNTAQAQAAFDKLHEDLTTAAPPRL